MLLLLTYFKQVAFFHKAQMFIFSVTDWKRIPSPQKAGGQQKETRTQARTQAAAKAPSAGNAKLSFPQHSSS